MFVLENNIENELINVGSNKEISIKNLVLIIQKKLSVLMEKLFLIIPILMGTQENF